MLRTLAEEGKPIRADGPPRPAESVHLASAAGSVRQRRQPAPDADVCLHDLPRRARERHRLQVGLAHAQHDARQASEWTKEHGWFDNHHWIYPMYAKRFTEARA